MRRKKRKRPIPVKGSQRRELIQAIDAYESNPTSPAAYLLLKKIRTTVSAMQEPDPPLILRSIDRLRAADAGRAADTIELLQGKVEGLMPMQPQEPAPDPEQPAIPEQEPAITRQPAEARESEPVEAPIHILTPQEQRNLEIELCKAAYEGDANRVYNLLEYGVSPDSKDATNNSALYFALDQDHLEAAELLINRGATVSLGSQEKLNHSLRIAAYNGEAEKVDKLIAIGAEVNARDNNDCSALFYALAQDHLDVAELLINRGATITPGLQEKLNHSLRIAAYDGEIEKIEKLIALGADVKGTDSRGCSPLFFASQNGHYYAVKLLLENNADPNVASTAGTTPLVAALRNGHYKIANLLKEHGAEGPSIWLYRLKEKSHLIFLSLVFVAALGIGGYSIYQIKRIQDIRNARQTVHALYREKGSPALAGVLKSEDEYVRAQAAFLLGEKKEKSAFRPLVKALADEEEHVQNAAAWAIGHIVRKHPSVNALPAIPSLIRMLKRDNEELWTNSSFALAEILVRNPKNPDLLKTIPLLAERTNAKKSKVRLNVGWILSHIAKEGPQKNPELPIAIPSLIGRLGDSDLDVRNNAAWALGNIAKNTRNQKRMEPAIVPLKRLLSDPKTEDSARYALEKINELP